MSKRRLHERTTQTTGNVLRTVMIWAGAGLALLAGILMLTELITEKVGLYLLVGSALAYWFALFDFDVDDDD